jgi:hypothetical protein
MNGEPAMVNKRQVSIDHSLLAIDEKTPVPKIFFSLPKNKHLCAS